MKSILDKKFIRDLRRLMIKTCRDNQDYVRCIIGVFIECYGRQLEEVREDVASKIKLIAVQVKVSREGFSKQELVSIDNIEKRIEEYIYNNLKDIDAMTVGNLYQAITGSKYKKKNGQIYTPEYIIAYMVEESISKDKVIKNPYIKILDPSSGSGYFLIAIFKRLLAIFTLNREEIISKNAGLQDEYERGISSFIIKNCIYGVEKESFSYNLSKLSLLLESGHVSSNILCKDMLFDLFEDKMDLVIGNPPYIGTKRLDGDYRERLRKVYSRVYEDKSDISYCFFQRANEILLNEGQLNIISSRYMIEAHHAQKLRNYIYSEFNMESIVDFYGQNVFKGVGVSPAIFKLKKSKDLDYFNYARVGKNKDKDIRKSFDEIKFFQISRRRLKSDRWIMETDELYGLYNLIDRSGDIRLSDITVSNQGIITGCDKAFVIDSECKVPLSERDALKPWIKSSVIDKYRVSFGKRYLISLKRGQIDSYENIRLHLEKYKSQLDNRRESKNGSKLWYELQWARDERKFKGKRIIFPYKAEKNKFALVEEEVYHSADIYSIKLRSDYKGNIDETYLLAYLNSSLFEFYFKLIAKKVGVDLFEYYPNRLMSLRLKLENNLKKSREITSLVEEVINSSSEEKKEAILGQIDDYFFSHYGISKKDQELIKQYIKDA